MVGGSGEKLKCWLWKSCQADHEFLGRVVDNREAGGGTASTGKNKEDRNADQQRGGNVLHGHIDR